MKNLKLILISFLFIFIMSACNSYGTEKNFGDLQLFYTENVEESEADELGKYLEEINFASNGRITVQLDKDGDTYQFRMVTKEGIDEDKSYIEMGKTFAGTLSNEVFDHKEVEMHFCDEHLKTLKVLKAY